MKSIKYSEPRPRDSQTEPGLVVLYDIRPGNRAGLFFQPRSPQGAGVSEPARGSVPWLQQSHNINAINIPTILATRPYNVHNPIATVHKSTPATKSNHNMKRDKANNCEPWGSCSRWIAEKLKLSGFSFFLCFCRQTHVEIYKMKNFASHLYRTVWIFMISTFYSE